MGKTISTLEEASKSVGLTLYELSLESKVRSNTLYDYKNNKSKFLNIKYINMILSTLNRVAKEKGYNRRFDYGDIFKYIEEEN
jgi:hypothetical protein